MEIIGFQFQLESHRDLVYHTFVLSLSGSHLHLLTVLTLLEVAHYVLQSYVSPVVLADPPHIRSSLAKISKPTYPGFPTPAD